MCCKAARSWTLHRKLDFRRWVRKTLSPLLHRGVEVRGLSGDWSPLLIISLGYRISLLFLAFFVCLFIYFYLSLHYFLPAIFLSFIQILYFVLSLFIFFLSWLLSFSHSVCLSFSLLLSFTFSAFSLSFIHLFILLSSFLLCFFHSLSLSSSVFILSHSFFHFILAFFFHF